MSANVTTLQTDGLDGQYRLLGDAITDYGIYMLDPDGHVSSWNSGANRFKGYTEAEILGEHFSRFYTPEDREARVPQRALATAANEGRFEAEGWRGWRTFLGSCRDRRHPRSRREAYRIRQDHPRPV